MIQVITDFFWVYFSAVLIRLISLKGLLVVNRARVDGTFIPFVKFIMSCWVITSCITLRSLSLNLSSILSTFPLSLMLFPQY